jgi:uncharacterized protein (TIGR02594 family)
MTKPSIEPAWLVEARKHIGERESKGPRHNSLILGWWRAIKRGGIKDDETPWCAAFVGGCLEAVGLRSSRFESARSYLEWGVRLEDPEVGAIVVFGRPGGGHLGHVGFVTGRDPAGNLLVLGGNQGDAVNVAAFPRSRVLGYRWPEPVPLPMPAPLPLSRAALSTSEA